MNTELITVLLEAAEALQNIENYEGRNKVLELIEHYLSEVRNEAHG